jgi:hypothetical protein
MKPCAVELQRCSEYSSMAALRRLQPRRMLAVWHSSKQNIKDSVESLIPSKWLWEGTGRGRFEWK